MERHGSLSTSPLINNTTPASEFTRPTTVTPVIAVSLIPPRCEKNPSACQVICCFSSVTPGGGSKSGPSSPPNDPCKGALPGQDCPYPGYPPYHQVNPPTFTLKPETGNHGYNTIIKPTIRGKSLNNSVIIVEPPNDAVQYSIDRPNDTPKVEIQDIYQGRRRRSVSVLGDKADVIIKELNETLGDMFCTNTECQSGQGYNFTYSVPVSPYFGLAMATLVFDLSDDFSVVLCKNATDSECGDKNLSVTPIRFQGHPHAWTLPVGYYQRSFYKFKVAKNEDKDLVCDLKDEFIGKRFAEYWMAFYRKKHDSCPSVSLK